MPEYFDSSVKKRDSVITEEEEELFREENKIGHVLAGSRCFRNGDHRLRREKRRVIGKYSRAGGGRNGREDGRSRHGRRGHGFGEARWRRTQGEKYQYGCRAGLR